MFMRLEPSKIVDTSDIYVSVIHKYLSQFIHSEWSTGDHMATFKIIQHYQDFQEKGIYAWE